MAMWPAEERISLRLPKEVRRSSAAQAPCSCPDQRHVLFTRFEFPGEVNAPQVWLLDLETREERMVLEAGRDPYYVSSRGIWCSLAGRR